MEETGLFLRTWSCLELFELPYQGQAVTKICLLLKPFSYELLQQSGRAANVIKSNDCIHIGHRRETPKMRTSAMVTVVSLFISQGDRCFCLGHPLSS